MPNPISLLTAVLVFSSGGVTAAIAADPCQTVIQACLKAGFQPGKGAGALDRACFRPIVYGVSQPKGVARALPTIDPKVANECRASLEPHHPAKASASPNNTEEPTAAESHSPTAVAPHNPPPTQPGPNR